MRKRHAKEIKALQAACHHKKAEWLPYEYAPGHLMGEVLLCRRCGEYLDSRSIFAEMKTTLIKSESGSLWLKASINKLEPKNDSKQNK